jgi:aspartate/methionine/tyrosine aminotransferase
VRDHGGVKQLSRRVAAIQESATLAVDARAKALKAAGEDVIGFGAGEPDFPTPSAIVEAAIDACRDAAMHHYTPASGLPALRRAIAEKTQRDSGLTVAPEQVLVTNGGKHAVATALEVLVDPGDEVLLPAPYWTTYPETVALAGGTTVTLPTTEATGFRVGVEQLEAACTPRTRALLFTSPSNPTGAVYPAAEIEAIGRWAVERGVWVITDEIYEHLTYGGHEFHSMPALVPELVDQCLVLNCVSKTYAMTGWRVGWLIGPTAIVKGAVNLQSQTTSNVGNVSQRAALAALEGGLDSVAEMRAAFERRGATMYEMLSAIPGVVCLPPEGAFYCFPSFEGVLGRELGGRVPATTMELAALLLDEVQVALVPGEAFGAPGYARLSFALADDALVEGVQRIAKLLG